MARTQQAGIVKSMTGATFNPDRLLSKPEEVRELLLGTIIGRANDICTSMGRDDEVLQGLRGMFAFVDADKERGTFKSYQFWPMGGMMQDLFELPAKKEQIDFAFEIWAIRAGNAAKRSWKVVPLMEASSVDPLQEVANKAGVALAKVEEAPAIEDKTGEAEAVKEPAGEAAKEPAKGGKAK